MSGLLHNSPKCVTTVIVCEIIKTINTAKNARQDDLFVHSGRRKPAIAEGFNYIQSFVMPILPAKLIYIYIYTIYIYIYIYIYII